MESKVRAENGIVHNKTSLKVFCIAILGIITFVGLGPARWQPRSGFGWELDHFVGYFVITAVCCLAWPRPLLVGGILVAFAVLLEGLQALMPDRSSYWLAAVYSAAGVVTGAVITDLFLRARRRLQSNRAEKIKV